MFLISEAVGCSPAIVSLSQSVVESSKARSSKLPSLYKLTVFNAMILGCAHGFIAL